MVNYKQKYLEMKLKYINAKQKAGMNLEQDIHRIEIEALIENDYNEIKHYFDEDMFNYMDFNDKQLLNFKKKLVDDFNFLSKWYTTQPIPFDFLQEFEMFKNFIIMLNSSNLPTFITKDRVLGTQFYNLGYNIQFLQYVAHDNNPMPDF
jgi:hypothetical protein